MGGVINAEDDQFLRQDSLVPEDATKLVSAGKEVRIINDIAIRALPTNEPSYTYECYDYFDRRKETGSILMFDGCRTNL